MNRTAVFFLTCSTLLWPLLSEFTGSAPAQTISAQKYLVYYRQPNWKQQSFVDEGSTPSYTQQAQTFLDQKKAAGYEVNVVADWIGHKMAKRVSYRLPDWKYFSKYDFGYQAAQSEGKLKQLGFETKISTGSVPIQILSPLAKPIQFVPWKHLKKTRE